MTVQTCVYCHIETGPNAIRGTAATLSGAPVRWYAHPDCAQEAGHTEEIPDPPDRDVHADRSVLRDLPPWFPGGLVAAFGLARRRTAAALLLLLWPLPAGGIAVPQTVEVLAADAPAHASEEPPQSSPPPLSSLERHHGSTSSSQQPRAFREAPNL